MDKESLAEKLKSLGVNLGTKNISAKKSLKRAAIQDVVSGRIIANAEGEFFLHEEQFGWEAVTEPNPFLQPPVWGPVFDWARLPGLEIAHLGNIIFLDTETSSLAGGTGTIPFMVGYGAFNETGFLVRQYFLREPSEELAMLHDLTRAMNGCELLVSFNGKSFDVPLLNARHVINRVQSPFKNLGHLDLLHLARKIWKKRLEDRSLKALEREILGFERTDEEIPSWMVPEIYFEYLRTGDPAPLAGVFYHNANDILSLGILLLHITSLLNTPDKAPKPQALDQVSIARIYEEQENYARALELYEQGLALGLPQDHAIDTLLRAADLCKKNRNGEKAVTFWQQAAEKSDLQACIELAKWHEHTLRDIPAALKWTEQAMAMVEISALTPFRKREARKELGHRKERLQLKQQKSATRTAEDTTEN